MHTVSGWWTPFVWAWANQVWNCSKGLVSSWSRSRAPLVYCSACAFSLSPAGATIVRLRQKCGGWWGEWRYIRIDSHINLDVFWGGWRAILMELGLKGTRNKGDRRMWRMRVDSCTRLADATSSATIIRANHLCWHPQIFWRFYTILARLLLSITMAKLNANRHNRNYYLRIHQKYIKSYHDHDEVMKSNREYHKENQLLNSTHLFLAPI